MTKRRHISTTMRVRIFGAAGGICSICGQPIDGTREAWEVSHETPLALGGRDEESNMRPAHKKCHRRHTAEVDIPQIAKAKRVRAKNMGAHRTRSALPGGRDSEFKRTVDGRTVRRDAE